MTLFSPASASPTSRLPGEGGDKSFLHRHDEGRADFDGHKDQGHRWRDIYPLPNIPEERAHRTSQHSFSGSRTVGADYEKSAS